EKLSGPFTYDFGEGCAPRGSSEVTSTEISHANSLVPSLPFVTSIVLPLADASICASHVAATFGSAAIVRPAGRVSVNDHPSLAESSDVFVMVKVSREVCPTGTRAGSKPLFR